MDSKPDHLSYDMTLDCQAWGVGVGGCHKSKQGKKARKSFSPLLQEPMAPFEDVMVASTSLIINGSDI